MMKYHSEVSSSALSGKEPSATVVVPLSAIEHLAEKVYASPLIPIPSNNNNSDDESRPVRQGPAKRECHFCNKLCDSNADLDHHLRTHEEETPFKCFSCTYSSSFEMNFVRHMERHQKEEDGRNNNNNNNNNNN